MEVSSILVVTVVISAEPWFDSDTTRYGSQEQKHQGATPTLVLHPKPKGKQIAIHAVRAALAFMFPERTSLPRWFSRPNRYGRDGGTVTLLQNGQCWRGPRQTPPAVTEVLHGSPAT